MHWKDLEHLIQDHDDAELPEERVKKISAELLGQLQDDAKPLQAAKIAYVLSLLQLKSKGNHEQKAIQFVDYLATILKHEIQEVDHCEKGSGLVHLHYVRKLAEHYYHHLMSVAELRGSKKALKKLAPLRKKNHQELLKLQNSGQVFWQREQKVIKRALKKHYLFTGFLFSIALYFAWTSFWNLSDFVLSQWVYSQYSAESITEVIQRALLLLFSISFIWGFVSYQKDAIAEEVGE